MFMAIPGPGATDSQRSTVQLGLTAGTLASHSVFSSLGRLYILYICTAEVSLHTEPQGREARPLLRCRMGGGAGGGRWGRGGWGGGC
jgi:hypothetical protein